jgi:epoxyqueuosine reductase
MNMLSSIINRAESLGFLAIGFSKPRRPPFFEAFVAFLADKRNADLSWLERHMEMREDPTRLLEKCRSIISLAFPYPAEKPSTSDEFTIARYARPSETDYHFRLKGLCQHLADMIKEGYPGSRTRICVDSAPLMERSFAFAAGLGFIGKNNMLIVPGHGSYLYLAEILTTAPFEFTPVRPMETRCGQCTLCIEACPTGALEAPFLLDVSRCLSYLTIEHKGEVGDKAPRLMGNCFFGCDRCQEVCPFNGPERPQKVCLPSTQELLDMDEKDFREKYGRTSLSRPGLEKLKRNIRAVRTKPRPPSSPG